MRVIISPAKKMRVDTDSFAVRALPAFLPEARRLLVALTAMDGPSLKRLWKCNDAITALNLDRLAHMELERDLTPALLSYQGIQYQYMAPGVFSRNQLEYVQEHLRILSGFYGLLRPFDGVTPYRLEMAASLSVDGHKDLYAFWGDRLAAALATETGLVVNLASKEYSRAVSPHLPPAVRFLTCTFGELIGDKVVEKGTMCKMARGQMVRWMAEHDAAGAEELQAFADLGYRFDPQRSTPEHYVFLKEDS
ncbi:peroxide stress protein YaaA [Pseudoflavonifractor phocaeensis]|uniref:peroxide stress protein YaaA n=1 Tax=Pseudoflavonifractor phocaeensis TaxID=1870988 RepID=UPI001959B3E3|nr:peroxide stress protein YaaA [Pseudoflavonifractor phocaeensis]